MVLLFGNFNTLVPSVQFLVHGHSLFDFIMLNENSFGFMELFIEDGQFGLDPEVVDAFLSHQLVDLAKVVCL